ncbi:hypothetical protein ATKI12_7672 [Kitasatospora sp. Ki12]
MARRVAPGSRHRYTHVVASATPARLAVGFGLQLPGRLWSGFTPSLDPYARAHGAGRRPWFPRPCPLWCSVTRRRVDRTRRPGDGVRGGGRSLQARQAVRERTTSSGRLSCSSQWCRSTTLRGGRVDHLARPSGGRASGRRGGPAAARLRSRSAPWPGHTVTKI